jgi:hypothetical protein
MQRIAVTASRVPRKEYSLDIHTFKTICKTRQSENNREDGVRRMQADDDVGDNSAKW